MLYFDSSYLFRLYSTEPGSAAVQDLAAGTDGIAAAWHGRAEFASILLRKRRELALSDAVSQEIGNQLHEDMLNGVIVFLFPTEAIMERLEFSLRSAPSTTYIRAADALHLASAAEHGFTEVFSNDKHFLAAAPLFGLRGVNIIA